MFIRNIVIAAIIFAIPGCGDTAHHDDLRLLVLGQSNAGAHAEMRTATTTGKVFSEYRGQITPYADPPRGTTTWEWGEGSIWGMVGDALVNAGDANTVTVTNISRGGSSIAAWSRLGLASIEESFPSESACNDLLGETLPAGDWTHIIWMQGESDRGKGYGYYYAHLLDIVMQIRERTDAVIMISQTSACDDAGDEEIRRAQWDIVESNPNLNLLHGPDTDAIAPTPTRMWHKDNCHLSARNQRDLAFAFAFEIANQVGGE